MAGDSVSSHSQDGDVQREQEMTQLITQITDLCVAAHLAYDGSLPTNVSPGVWKFMAVEMNDSCTKWGTCRQRAHYAIDLGDRVVLG
mgnify:CR=1 FL=1